MQCVILAGGLGTRMRPFTEILPKALIPVHGQPFVGYQLEWLASQGVRDVVLSIGYKGDMIRHYAGDGSAWGISVNYVDEGRLLRGTGGALRLAAAEAALDDEFLVLYGDSYLPISLGPIWRRFQESGADGLMTVHRNDGRWDASNVVFEDGRVVVYDKRRAQPLAARMRFIDAGLSALRLNVVQNRLQPCQKADLADLLHDLSIAGTLQGWEVKQRFYEIGSLGGLRDFTRYAARRPLPARAARGGLRAAATAEMEKSS